MHKQTTIRVEKRLLDRIKDLAKDRQCSMNQMIIYLLEESILSYYQKEYECRKIKNK